MRHLHLIIKPILLIAYQLGPRFGEIMSLTWDRVDLQRGFIKLQGVDMKTREPRLVKRTMCQALEGIASQ